MAASVISICTCCNFLFTGSVADNEQEAQLSLRNSRTNVRQFHRHNNILSLIGEQRRIQDLDLGGTLSAEGARVGWIMGRGTLSPLREGLGKGQCPLLTICFKFFVSLIAYFGAFWRPFWVLRCLIQQGKGRLLASWGAWSLGPPKSATVGEWISQFASK